jgi:hypothetical protein
MANLQSLNDLPNELLFMILERLDSPSIPFFSSVNRNFRILAKYHNRDDPFISSNFSSLSRFKFICEDCRGYAIRHVWACPAIAHYGDTETLKYAREQGHEWSEDIFYDCVHRDPMDVDILEYLFECKCPCDFGMLIHPILFKVNRDGLERIWKTLHGNVVFDLCGDNISSLAKRDVLEYIKTSEYRIDVLHVLVWGIQWNLMNKETLDFIFSRVDRDLMKFMLLKNRLALIIEQRNMDEQKFEMVFEKIDLIISDLLKVRET